MFKAMEQGLSTPLTVKKRRGRPCIKSSGSPLTNQERKERAKKKKQEGEAKKRAANQRQSKSRTSRVAMKNEDEYSTGSVATAATNNTGSVKYLDAPPTPVQTPATGSVKDPDAPPTPVQTPAQGFYRLSTPGTPLSVRRTRELVPRTPLSENQIRFACAAVARRDKIRQRKMDAQKESLDTTQKNNNALACAGMQKNQEAADSYNKYVEKSLDEELQDHDILADLEQYGAPAEGDFSGL